ncbi:MAG: LysM peptidoglycan-binding domain-containing protein [Clostridia bacterium]|nr:LysM peptidoglycan-binding domain-containing protein [Clostridia bacterium]
MLKLEVRNYYKVKRGQSLREIASAFCVAERLLILENGLTEEVREGQLLRIPAERGNAYVAQCGQDKALLCGSGENFRRKNGTDTLYPGMRVIL